MHDPTAVLAVLAALVFVGLALEELFRRTGIPDVLVLLGLGVLVSTLGLFRVEDLHGLERIFTTIALVLILFEGAVHLRLEDLRRALGGALLLTLVSFFVTLAVVGTLATLLFGLRPLAGALLGAIVAGTAPAVVIPLARALDLAPETRTALTLESALSEVLSIVFGLVLLGALASGALSFGTIGGRLLGEFGGALLLGAGAGFAWAVGLRALRRRRSSMAATGAVVFLVYALAETLHTAGPIACMAFGIVLGNASLFAGRSSATAELDLTAGERAFISEVAFLLKVFFFVYLGVALRLRGYEPLVFGGLVTVFVYAVRPFIVRLTLSSETTTRRDAAVAAVLVPKGLAAAVLAELPLQARLAEGRVIHAVAFGVILLSIIATSVLVFALDRPFVARAYGRIFRGYGGPPEEAAPARTAAEEAGILSCAPEDPAVATQARRAAAAEAGILTSTPDEPPEEPPAAAG